MCSGRCAAAAGGSVRLAAGATATGCVGALGEGRADCAFAESQNCQPGGAGGHDASGVQPKGGFQPAGGAGQPGAGLNRRAGRPGMFASMSGRSAARGRNGKVALTSHQIEALLTPRPTGAVIERSACTVVRELGARAPSGSPSVRARPPLFKIRPTGSRGPGPTSVEPSSTLATPRLVFDYPPLGGERDSRGRKAARSRDSR